MKVKELISLLSKFDKDMDIHFIFKNKKNINKRLLFDSIVQLLDEDKYGEDKKSVLVAFKRGI